jgi:hypothetical protein
VGGHDQARPVPTPPPGPSGAVSAGSCRQVDDSHILNLLTRTWQAQAHHLRTRLAQDPEMAVLR